MDVPEKTVNLGLDPRHVYPVLSAYSCVSSREGLDPSTKFTAKFVVE